MGTNERRQSIRRTRPFIGGPRVGVVFAVALMGASGLACTDTRDVGVDNVPTTTIATNYDALATRLGGLNTDEIVMDASFNRDLVRLGLRTIGFDATEAMCAADAIAAATPGGMRGAVSTLFDASSMSPEVMAGCITLDRFTQVGTPLTPDALPAEVTAEFQQLGTLLAAAGFETLGLTTKEAACLGSASTTTATLSAMNTGGMLSPLGAPITVDVVHVRSCVTEDRVAQLLR